MANYAEIISVTPSYLGHCVVYNKQMNARSCLSAHSVLEINFFVGVASTCYLV